MQTGIGARQNHSDQCRMRIETELTKTDNGQLRFGKSKDRVDNWTAKSGKVIMQIKTKKKTNVR